MNKNITASEALVRERERALHLEKIALLRARLDDIPPEQALKNLAAALTEDDSH